MNRADCIYLAGRCRMGDKQAALECRRILREGLRMPSGHPKRELARCLAEAIREKRSTRSAYLPQPDFEPQTRLAAKLLAIFQAHGGQVHLKARQ